jgi:hypothetical protein
MRQLLEGSRGLPSIDEMMNPVAGANPRKVIQDRYSIRCLPQYLGPILDGMNQIAKQVGGRGLVPPAFFEIVSGCAPWFGGWPSSVYVLVAAGRWGMTLRARSDLKGGQELFSLTPSCPFGMPVISALGLL